MSYATFIPKLWAARLKDQLEESHIATAFVNRDFEGEIKHGGDTVHVNSLGPVTVKDYDSTAQASGIDAPEELSTTDQTLVIDQGKYFNFRVNDIDAVQSAGPIMDKAMHNAGYDVADKIDKYIFKTISEAAPEGNIVGNNSTELTANNVWNDLVQLRTILNKRHVPKNGRKIACSSDATGVILNDDRFVKVGTDASNERLENGIVARAAGFDIFETENVPQGEILATVPMATSFAEQIVEIEAYRPENNFSDAVKGLNVYGIKCFYPEAVAKAVYKTKNFDAVTLTFGAVASPSGNPKTKGYHEKDGDNYVPSTDTTVDGTKTYYEVTNPTGTPKSQGFYELVNGWYVKSTDTLYNGTKTYYEVEE